MVIINTPPCADSGNNVISRHEGNTGGTAYPPLLPPLGSSASTPSKDMKLLLKYSLLVSRKFELRASRVGLERRGMMFLLRGSRRMCIRRWATLLER